MQKKSMNESVNGLVQKMFAYYGFNFMFYTFS